MVYLLLFKCKLKETCSCTQTQDGQSYKTPPQKVDHDLLKILALWKFYHSLPALSALILPASLKGIRKAITYKNEWFPK